MLQQPKIIRRTLSVRIGLMVVTAMAILLMASMIVMLYYSRKAVKEEATQKAQQALEGMVYNIDNIMLSVEQTTGNIYFSMLSHLKDTDMMYMYARKLVETNPYVAGCAIAFKEDFCKDGKPFMAYVHHADSAGMAYADADLVTDDMFGNEPYTEQAWFRQPLETGKVGWMIPHEVMKREENPIFTFCLPIYQPDSYDKPIGVIGVDVSISLLSDIVNNAKPSANSYCTLIDHYGTYIVHPNDNKLLHETDKVLKDQSARDAAQAMISGNTGYKPFKLNGTDYFVFYQPFKRTTMSSTSDHLGWYVGVVYPEDDIFGDYNSLSHFVLAIVVIGLLLSFLISGLVIHSQLKPLLMLTAQAQHIAKGNLNALMSVIPLISR